MTRRKIETAASLRGVRTQLRKEINFCDREGGGTVFLTLRQAKRIEEAIKQFERVLSEPSQ